MTPADARRIALRAFGHVGGIEEACRDTRRVRLMDDLLRDVRYGARVLWREPGFALVAILTLALGIGANTAIFSVVNGLLLRSVYAPNIERIVAVAETRRSRSQPVFSLTPDETSAIEASHLAAIDRLFFTAPYPLRGALSSASDVNVVMCELVSGGYFDALGVRPRAGRLLTSADDQGAAGTAIVISERLWRRAFGASPSAIGSIARMSGSPLTIVGVVPERFRGTWLPTMTATDVWVPLTAEGRLRPSLTRSAPASSSRRTFARLRVGAHASGVDAAISTIGRALHSGQPAQGLAVFPAQRAILDYLFSLGRPIGGVAVALSGLVFLIACANLTNLLLARTMSRAGEMAVRIAAGAGRARIFRLLLTEVTLVAAIGGVMGLLLAQAITRVIAILRLPDVEGLAIQVDPTPDLHVFGYAFLIALAAALVVGVLPAWHAARTDPLRLLATGGAGASTMRGRRLRTTLVAAQVTMSVVLLLLAGLFVRSWQSGGRFERTEGASWRASMASVDMGLQHRDEEHGRALQHRLLEAAARIPGVERAALASALPTMASRAARLLRDDQPSDSFRGGTLAFYTQVSPGFFETMRIPLRRGRDFSVGDTVGAPAVGIVSESAARTIWPGGDPIGRWFSIRANGPLIEVVGVVADVPVFFRRGTGDVLVYLPADQDYSAAMSVIVATADPAGVLDPLRRALRAVDPDLAVFDVETVEGAIDASRAPMRVVSMVLLSLGILGFAIAILGLYGVMAFFVSQRTREFGIRRALGASGAMIYSVVVRSGLSMLLAGVILGAFLTVIASGLLRRVLYGVDPLDVVTFTAVPAALVVAGLAACFLAARRAVRVDPNVALRDL
jgi:predicted permease